MTEFQYRIEELAPEERALPDHAHRWHIQDADGNDVVSSEAIADFKTKKEAEEHAKVSVHRKRFTVESHQPKDLLEHTEAKDWRVVERDATGKEIWRSERFETPQQAGLACNAKAEERHAKRKAK